MATSHLHLEEASLLTKLQRKRVAFEDQKSKVFTSLRREKAKLAKTRDRIAREKAKSTLAETIGALREKAEGLKKTLRTVGAKEEEEMSKMRRKIVRQKEEVRHLEKRELEANNEAVKKNTSEEHIAVEAQRRLKSEYLKKVSEVAKKKNTFGETA